jgi:DNA-binding response OmpR family regulator
MVLTGSLNRPRSGSGAKVLSVPGRSAVVGIGPTARLRLTGTAGGTVSRDRPVVLIVDRDPDTRDRVGGWLEDEGLDVVACPGPTAPEFRCIGSRDGHCPLAQEADLIVLDLWLESDAAMLGTRSTSLVRFYRSWHKPLVVMSDRHDDVAEWIEDLSVAAVDWPPDRRDLVETIRVITKA